MDDLHPFSTESKEFETAGPEGEVDAPQEHRLAGLYRELMRGIGEDVRREGLVGTPNRAAKAFEFLTRGYREDIESLVNGAVFQSTSQDMVLVRNIEFYSLCEHHILPFFGKVHVAYLPAGKVIGLSKIPRIVDVFARRLQIQENLTEQIAQCIEQVTLARGVAVIVEARHMCMLMRGVEKQAASMLTSSLRGKFQQDESLRNQLLRFLPASAGES
ncbi:GTP cyclohydrolase I FolE [Solimonas fluminis]|uniref:GTP cyclohydrolase 1 n=1 Tax=Solimonas fluminis TaxID=2086571 RepID=A0A2S5TGS1_9GAMM|nr:GTP cyclohydrolase I FolE [Solimonas fluminis]